MYAVSVETQMIDVEALADALRRGGEAADVTSEELLAIVIARRLAQRLYSALQLLQSLDVKIGEQPPLCPACGYDDRRHQKGCPHCNGKGTL